MTKEQEADLLREAQEAYKQDKEAMADIWAAMEEDLEFENGQQWPKDVEKERADEGRPCLTINKLIQNVNQVVNDQRQNRPRFKASAVDDSTDPDTAEVINGLLLHIQNRSDSEVAFDTADDFAVSCGIGYVRVLTDYCDDESFDQEILIKRIDNPFSVLFPINHCSEADWSDANHCFVLDKMSRREYKETHGDDPDMWVFGQDGLWLTEDDVMIAEYWKVEEEEKTLYLLADGTTATEKPEGIKVLKERKTPNRKVKCYKLSANKVLEEKEWASKWLPIIPVTGKEINIKGKKSYISLIRFAKDPQRNFNYWKSAQTERIALAPLAPFVGYTGQFKDPSWGLANRKTIPYLEAEPLSINGTLAPLPRRQEPVSNDAGIVEAIREASDDIKATTGLYDASLGAKGNETSGIAIRQREKQGDTATFHFTDNSARAMRHCGRIVVDLIPKIIDTPRAIRILGEDMTEKVVKVNQMYFDRTKSKEVLYDVTAGKYDVTVDIGPGYSTKRQESAQLLVALAEKNPNIANTTSDLLAKFLELPSEIVDRLRKTLPPGLLENEQGGEAMSEEEVRQIVGDLERLMQEQQMSKQVMAKMEQIIQQLEAQLKDKQQSMAIDLEKAQIKGESDVAKEVIKADAQRDKAQIDAASKIFAARSGNRASANEGRGASPNDASQ